MQKLLKLSKQNYKIIPKTAITKNIFDTPKYYNSSSSSGSNNNNQYDFQVNVKEAKSLLDELEGLNQTREQKIDSSVYNHPLLIFPVQKPIFPNNVFATQVSKQYYQFIKENNIQYLGAFVVKDQIIQPSLKPIQGIKERQYLKISGNVYSKDEQLKNKLQAKKNSHSNNKSEKKEEKNDQKIKEGEQEEEDNDEEEEIIFELNNEQSSSNQQQGFKQKVLNSMITYDSNLVPTPDMNDFSTYYQKEIMGLNSIQDVHKYGTICDIKFEQYKEQGQKQIVALFKGIKRIQMIGDSGTFVYFSKNKLEKNKKIADNSNNKQQQQDKKQKEVLQKKNQQENKIKLDEKITLKEQKKEIETNTQTEINHIEIKQELQKGDKENLKINEKIKENSIKPQKIQINFAKVTPIRELDDQKILYDKNYQSMLNKVLLSFNSLKKQFPINTPELSFQQQNAILDVLCGFLAQTTFFSKQELIKLFETDHDHQKLKLCLEYFEKYESELIKYRAKNDSKNNNNSRSNNDSKSSSKSADDNNNKDPMDQISREQKENQQIYEYLKGMLESPSIKKLVNQFNEKIQGKSLPPKILQTYQEEISHLQELSEGHPEYESTKQVLEMITDLPWGVTTEDNFNLQNAKQILDKEHFGMEEVKQRILEFIAVSKLKGNVKGKTILLVGPPGTGKTSIASSIASCLGRNFQRISLGGESDVAIIKGHRKTYIGSYPGKIIQSLKLAKSENPVILIDEVEKATSSHKGNIQEALLQVLDPIQNDKFVDNFLEFEVDLSKVLFLCSANLLETLHPALLDRMDVIELSGYTTDEKKEIFNKHILQRSLQKSGIDLQKNFNLNFTKNAVEKLVLEYAREPGMRNLERKTNKICEKIALRLATGKISLPQFNQQHEEKNKENDQNSKLTTNQIAQQIIDLQIKNEIKNQKQQQQQQQTIEIIDQNQQNDNEQQQKQQQKEKEEEIVQFEITEKNLREFVGLPTFSKKQLYSQTIPKGVIRGLAYNSYGGSLIFIEATKSKFNNNNAQNNNDNNNNSEDKEQQQQNEEKKEVVQGSIQYTGSLGDVMKESVEIAYSNVKRYCAQHFQSNKNIQNFFDNNKIHIHFTDGATPKDGPSAGISISSALVSLALDKPCRNDVAMTGEISATGKVLNIGGIREKILAAKRDHIYNILLPIGNEPDYKELRKEIKEGVTPIFVSNLDQVVDFLFFQNEEQNEENIQQKQQCNETNLNQNIDHKINQ